MRNAWSLVRVQFVKKMLKKKSLKSFISLTKIDNFPETLFFLIKRWETVHHHDEQSS